MARIEIKAITNNAIEGLEKMYKDSNSITLKDRIKLRTVGGIPKLVKEGEKYIYLPPKIRDISLSGIRDLWKGQIITSIYQSTLEILEKYNIKESDVSIEVK